MPSFISVRSKLGVSIGSVLFVLAPTVWLLAVHPAAPAPIYHFSFAMNWPLTFFYPLIACSLYLGPHLSLWRRRAVLPITLRTGIARFVTQSLLRNVSVVFFVFFLQVIVTFAVVFWVEPTLGFEYESRKQWGDVTPIVDYARLSGLAALGLPVYMLGYGLCLAAVAVGLALFGHLLLLAGVPGLISLLAPTVVFLVQSFVTHNAASSLQSAMIQFGVGDEPPTTLIVPLGFLALLLAGTAAAAFRRVRTVVALQ